MTMQAFVTGASGFIGGHLSAALVRRGWTVRALVHQTKLSGSPEVQAIRGDIQDFGLLKEVLQGTDVLFHLAAALGASLIDRDKFFRINVEGTENVLRAARENAVKKVIHFSSAGVLGAVKKNDVAAEDYPLNPQNIYDLTKLEGEKTALRFAAEGMKVAVIRPGWTYGPGDRRTFKLIKSINQGRFFLVAGGKGVQTPIYIEELVDGILLCAENGRPGEIYHLAGKEILQVREMAEDIAAACGKRIPRFSLPRVPARLAAFALEKLFGLAGKEAPLSRSKLSFFLHSKPLSIQKAEREFGFSPGTDFKKGIRLAVSWYKENGWL